MKYIDCMWLFLLVFKTKMQKDFPLKIWILLDGSMGFPFCLMDLGNLVKYMDCIWLFLPNRYGTQNKDAERFSVKNLDIAR